MAVEALNQTQDLTIIGGGIMGLMTAYYASALAENITIIDQNVIGPANTEASSFSISRSLHTDQLDSKLAQLANEARSMWLDIERTTGRILIEKSGSLNIAKASITPIVNETYAARAAQINEQLHFQPELFLSYPDLREHYPQFDADFGFLNPKGGYFYQRKILSALLDTLHTRGVSIFENTTTESIEQADDSVCVKTDKGEVVSSKTVLTPGGKWANGVLDLVDGNRLQLPITLSQPQEGKYYYPSQDTLWQYRSPRFPVFAYLDVGIYGHPLINNAERNALKIAYYVPTDFEGDSSDKITCVADFVAECMPDLADATVEDVTDADKCFYDNVKDGKFIIGELPGYPDIYIGTGCQGAGYKYSPWFGRTLSQLALQGGTVYNISQFSPGRFA